MTPFRLKIITPYGVFFDGETTNVIVRTTEGDMAVLAGIQPYVSVLGIGKLRIMLGEKYRYASTSGGIIKADKNETVIIANTCEWADEIDIIRAENAKQIAEERRKNANTTNDIKLAEYKLHRAINRIDTAKFK
ncbi:MAG: ATP synthase F1 subunit epsilon [Clostridiales bacterium]|nr:ATP synthase F1 subunit epsilon [Clostridiales bacterium]